MHLRTAVPILAFSFGLALAGPLAADSHQDDVDTLFEALALPEIVSVMRDEGLEYGETIGTDLLSGRAGADWAEAVDAIYDRDRMAERVRSDLAEALTGRDLAPMIAFFTSEPGRTIIALEVSARTAMIDAAVEEAAKEAAAIAIADQTPRYALIQRFVEVNELIETNVVGAMNANYAFYIGLLDGGALPGQLTEDEILADVWSQEPEIRQTTTEWVYSFLMMAYQPLTDADIEAYVAFSETEAGAALNRAVFDAFDGMFEEISNSLGMVSARFMIGSEL